MFMINMIKNVHFKFEYYIPYQFYRHIAIVFLLPSYQIHSFGNGFERPDFIKDVVYIHTI